MSAVSDRGACRVVHVQSHASTKLPASYVHRYFYEMTLRVGEALDDIKIGPIFYSYLWTMVAQQASNHIICLAMFYLAMLIMTDSYKEHDISKPLHLKRSFASVFFQKISIVGTSGTLSYYECMNTRGVWWGARGCASNFLHLQAS